MDNAKGNGSFWVLRRWNSYTPSIPVEERGVGGGYFLEWEGKGLVIDPGFDFLANLQRCGIGLEKINAILVTHSHIDHTDQLRSIATQKYERYDLLIKNNMPIDKPIDIFASEDTLDLLSSTIRDQSREVLKHPFWTLAEQPVDLFAYGYSIKMQPFRVLHAKPPESPLKDAVGLVLSLYNNFDLNRRVKSIGYTSDTRYDQSNPISSRMIDLLRSCEIMVTHLGTLDICELIKVAELGFDIDLQETCKQVNVKSSERRMIAQILGAKEGDPLDKHIAKLFEGRVEPSTESAHLGFLGLYELLSAVFARGSSAEIAVISEFGEELGSFRHKIGQVLNLALFADKRGDGLHRIFTGDVGLSMAISGEKRKCSRCGSEKTSPLIQCTSCMKFFCPSCIDDVCIKHRKRGIYYDCIECNEPDYYPKSPLVSL